MSSDDYFSPRAVRQRVRQRYDRRLWLFIHLAVTVSFTVFLIAERLGYYTSQSLVLAGVTWLLFLMHLILAIFQGRMYKEIDAEMREAREYELRRYEVERDPAYRLSDDGELFYDADEIESETLKPKRKRED